MPTYPFERALVTGASSGIGLSFARNLASAGVPVVVVARRRDRLEELAREFSNVEVLDADLQTVAGIDKVVDRISSSENPIDLVVNNAGFGSTGMFDTIDPERTRQEIALNVGALVRLSHAAVNTFLPRKHGYLLNVSSVGAFQPGPTIAVYAATKAFVTSFTEALAEENRRRGLNVSALHPGYVPTEFQAVASSNDSPSRIPGFMWLSPDRVVIGGLQGVAKGKTLVTPSLTYKSLVLMTKLLPRGATRRIVGTVLGD